jgi:hypothetical protein
MNWHNLATWESATINTMWCLIGYSIGDLGTIGVAQVWFPSSAVMLVMTIAIINGLLTSILLETIILRIRQKWPWVQCFKVAVGMSFISMVGMEIAMNATDYYLTGGAVLQWRVLPFILLVGFIYPLPYNYWRLEKHGKSCH